MHDIRCIENDIRCIENDIRCIENDIRCIENDMIYEEIVIANCCFDKTKLCVKI